MFKWNRQGSNLQREATGLTPILLHTGVFGVFSIYTTIPHLISKASIDLYSSVTYIFIMKP